MTEWKVVPVEPTPKMVAAYSSAAEDLIKRHHLSGSYPATWQPVKAGYTAMLAAAPTPPVMLPPLPKSVENKMSDFAVACARGGHEERVDSANALRREIESYARAALAQYGIVDRQEDAA